MNINPSVARTAPGPRKQKTPQRKKPSGEEIRFWKNVALSLATVILSLIFAGLLAVLLK